MAFSEDRAARYSKFAIGSGADQAVMSGGTCTVYGIIICHHGKEDDDGSKYVLFEDYNTTDEITRILVKPGETFESHIKWLAHKGLQVSLDAFYLDCTVFHSQSGS